jgi:hypothetical protein
LQVAETNEIEASPEQCQDKKSQDKLFADRHDPPSLAEKYTGSAELDWGSHGKV